ncbi:MAG: hypothetical protein K8R54_01885 [Bacteroidales bacterium]|nr:hypothetical protein [Bacteroidales bacterium]
MRKVITLSLLACIFIFVSCGEDNKEDKDVKLSEKGKLLTSVTWKYDTNASIKGTTDDIEDTTGISADVVLKDDVKSFADFLTGTLKFAIDFNDPSKLSYERKYGKGIFSTSDLGYWNFNEDETAIIMREWDKNAGKELAPVTKQIIELKKDRLVMKDEDGTEHFYIPQ